MVTISAYNPFAAEVKEDPYPYYAWLRERQPVYFNDQLGFWALSRYRDVVAAARNYEVFSSAQGIGPDKVRLPMMITQDPPEHRRLRALAGKAFTPRMVAQMEERVRAIVNRQGSERIAQIRNEMGVEMSENVGVFRTPERLQLAIEKVAELQQRVRRAPIDDKGKVFNTDLTGALELDAMLVQADIIARGALWRTESRGAQARLDYPERDDEEWQKHINVTRGDDGQPEISYSDVTITKWQPEVRKY